MSNAQTVVVRLLDSAEDKLLAMVFNLAERHKRWLGMLPPPAYAEYAEEALDLGRRPRRGSSRRHDL